jgi:hypothetical protein
MILVALCHAPSVTLCWERLTWALRERGNRTLAGLGVVYSTRLSGSGHLIDSSGLFLALVEMGSLA